MGKKKKDVEVQVPDELLAVWDKYNALLDLRDAYIKRPFGFKKAKWCAVKAREKRREFRQGVEALYPESLGKTIAFRSNGKCVLKDE